MRNFSPFSVKNVYVCGSKGAAPPCLRKFCILQAKYAWFQALFGVNLQKYIISGGGCKWAALLFIRECVFGGTINEQFHDQSLFCQNLYIYTISGVARGHCPLAWENFVFGGLNLHNFRPFFSLTVYKDIGFFLGGAQGYSSPHSKYWGVSAPLVPKPMQDAYIIFQIDVDNFETEHKTC